MAQHIRLNIKLDKDFRRVLGLFLDRNTREFERVEIGKYKFILLSDDYTPKGSLLYAVSVSGLTEEGTLAELHMDSGRRVRAVYQVA